MEFTARVAFVLALACLVGLSWQGKLENSS